MSGLLQILPAITIANGGTVSGAIDIGPQNQLVGFFFPAMTGTAVVPTSAVAVDGTYRLVKDSDDVAVSFVVSGTATYIGLTAAEYSACRGIRFLKLTSGSSEGADRSIQVVVETRR